MIELYLDSALKQLLWRKARHLHIVPMLKLSISSLNILMNAIPRQTSFHIDWVINYIEVNSRPSPSNDYCRLRITNSEIQIDPAGIVLTIQKSTDEGIELQCGFDTYFGTFVQRGNELVIKLNRSDSSDSVMVVAKRIVSEFDPSVSFGRSSQICELRGSAAVLSNEPSSFFSPDISSGNF